MAYQTGTATSQEDFLSKLFTFATANGWTQDQFSSGSKEAAMHRNSIYVSFRWDATVGGGISIHQALGYVGGESPGDHTNDSGNGKKTGTPINTERRVDRIGNGPFTNHWFFSDSVYLYAVLEYAPGLYRHVAFGELEKYGTWTGGEFAFGHTWWDNDVGRDDPRSTAHSLPFDAASTLTQNEQGTIHAESLPDEGGSSKWAVCGGFNLTLVGTDGDSNDRVNVFGGARSGPLTVSLSWIPANPNNGYVPLIPIPVFYHRETSPDKEWRLLGYAPGLRVINIRNIQPQEEFTVGSDTWKCFPWVRKRWQMDNLDESWTGGFAYLKT